MEIDTIRFAKYQMFKQILWEKWKSIRSDRPFDIARIIDEFSEELTNKINIAGAQTNISSQSITRENYMTDSILAIVFSQARSAINGNNGSITDRLKVAMGAARDNFLNPPDDTKIRAAVAAVMESYGEGSPEYDRLKWECQRINSLSAFLAATQAGLKVSIPENDNRFEPIGIMKIWEEVKDG